MGTDQEPGRRQAVDSRRGAGAGTVPDAHDPSKRHAPTMLTTDLALRLDPDLREDFEALPRESGPVRRRVRPGVVQADAPRHGPARALSRPGGPGGGVAVARPRPAVDHKLIDAQDIGALKAKILASGLSISATGLDRLGVGGDLPRLRQARRGERGAHPPRAAEGLGGQPAGPVGEGAATRSKRSRRSSTARSPAARRSRSPT